MDCPSEQRSVEDESITFVASTETKWDVPRQFEHFWEELSVPLVAHQDYHVK